MLTIDRYICNTNTPTFDKINIFYPGINLMISLDNINEKNFSEIMKMLFIEKFGINDISNITLKTSVGIKSFNNLIWSDLDKSRSNVIFIKLN
jgi:hypothetical protein